MKAFAFTNGMKLRDGAPLVEGKTYKFAGKIKIGKSGCCASQDPFYALYDALGCWLTLVECGGKIVTGEDSVRCSEMTVLKTLNVEKELRLFAVWCARRVAHFSKDNRIHNVIDVAERFAYGFADEEELQVAGDIADDASAHSDYFVYEWDAAWGTTFCGAGDAARHAEWQAQRYLAEVASFKAKIDIASEHGKHEVGIAAFEDSFDVSEAEHKKEFNSRMYKILGMED